MPTYDERREVVRRLRGDFCDTLIPYRTGVHFGMGCHEAANRFWDMCDRIKTAGDYDIAWSTCSVLADLIDPGDSLQTVAEDMFGQMRHSTEQERIAYADMMARNSVELHQVDRDALLALADEFESGARDARAHKWNEPANAAMAIALADEYEANARRIREACGEV